jgi:hypothetical protein
VNGPKKVVIAKICAAKYKTLNGEPTNIACCKSFGALVSFLFLSQVKCFYKTDVAQFPLLSSAINDQGFQLFCLLRCFCKSKTQSSSRHKI